MKNTKKNWDLISEERRRILNRDIITYFKTELDQEIGIIAAEDMLDFFLQTLGKDIYNKAIENSKVVARQTFDNLEVDLDLLVNK